MMALMSLSMSSVHRIEAKLYLSPSKASKQSKMSKQSSCNRPAEGGVSIGDTRTICTGGGGGWSCTLVKQA